MNLSRFNENGIKAFQSKLQDMRDGIVIYDLTELVCNEDLIEYIGSNPIEIKVNVFNSRYELAKYISFLLKKADVKNEMNDVGLWAWLSAVFIDTVSPADNGGKRFPKSDYRHIPSSNWTNYYRHLIRGSYRVYKLFENEPNSANIVLCQKPSQPGDFVEQLASRQERITNPAIISVANTLYLDKKNEKPIRGASPNHPKTGTLRRYTSVLDQLDLTYDLYSMSHDELFNILPSEFEVYK